MFFHPWKRMKVATGKCSILNVFHFAVECNLGLGCRPAKWSTWPPVSWPLNPAGAKAFKSNGRNSGHEEKVAKLCFNFWHYPALNANGNLLNVPILKQRCSFQSRWILWRHQGLLLLISSIQAVVWLCIIFISLENHKICHFGLWNC